MTTGIAYIRILCQYLVVPLLSSEADNGCERVRAVHDYALWSLQDQAAASIARSLGWAVMPDVVGERAVSIVANMTCTGRSALAFQTIHDIAECFSVSVAATRILALAGTASRGPPYRPPDPRRRRRPTAAACPCAGPGRRCRRACRRRSQTSSPSGCAALPLAASARAARLRSLRAFRVPAPSAARPARAGAASVLPQLSVSALPTAFVDFLAVDFE